MQKRRFITGLGLIASAALLGHARAARATSSYDPATGKWYESFLVPQGITWNAANADAIADGGYLTCPTTAAENTFVFDLIQSPAYWTALSVNSDFLGPWLGAYATNDTDGSDATFTWVNGATFSYAPWGANQPDGYPGNIPEQAVDYYDFASIGSTWGDTPQAGVQGFTLPQGYVVEFNQDPDAVPEPKTTALLALACAALCIRLRRTNARA